MRVLARGHGLAEEPGLIGFVRVCVRFGKELVLRRSNSVNSVPASPASVSKRGVCKILGTATVAVSAMVVGNGCEWKSFIDPGEVGRYDKSPLLMPILRKLDDTGIDEPNDEWANATDPTPGDLVFTSQDYVIGAGDVLNVSVADLSGPGADAARTYRVTDSGMLNMPLVDEVKAIDLTEAQLQKAIKKVYKDAGILSDANVTVTVVEARGRTFSILGAVGAPGEYQIVKKDFRLLDALVMARDATSGPGADFLYIYRKEKVVAQETAPTGGGAGSGSTTAPSTPTPVEPTTPPTTSPGPDILAPRTQLNRGAWRIDLLKPRMVQTAQPSNAPATPDAPATPAVTVQPAPENPAVAPVPTPVTPTATAPATQPNEGRYIILDGKPVLVGGSTQPSEAMPPSFMTPPSTMPAGEATTTPSTEPFAFQDITPPSGDRTIRIPLNQLRAGDFHYNVVIRPSDLIIVPSPKGGVYYMGGHVARTGVYSLNGPKVTLKQAIIAAGMLDQVAIPQRTDVIRRIGTDREVFARVNLDAIFDGKQSDIFLKPDDTIMVGTNFFAPFIAALRNGFRISYGFGFFLDRNFGDDVFGTTNNNGNNN